MSRDCGRTIAWRTPIRRCDDASARCNGSSQLDPRSAASVSMPPSTTPSSCNATSSRGPRCGPSEPKRRRSGKMPSQQHEIWLPSSHFRPVTVTVTRPARHTIIPPSAFACAVRSAHHAVARMPAMRASHSRDRRSRESSSQHRSTSGLASQGRSGFRDLSSAAAISRAPAAAAAARLLTPRLRKSAAT